MPPVTRTAETLAALQERYPRALEHVYDVRHVVAGGIRPGEAAAQVFDFEDGLRFIISRERMPDNSLILHLSASITPDCRIAQEMRLLSLTMSAERIFDMFTQSIPARFRELSGDERPPRFIGSSHSGQVGHWHIQEE